MIGVDPILDFLNIVLWTGVLEGEMPVSVIIVADSSSGKSELLKRMESPISIFITDMTTRDLSNIMADAKKRIILLSDMQAIFSHKATVVGTTTQALRNLLEEGIFNDPFSGAKINRRFAMISAIPPQEFNRINKIFVSGGLNTRFLVFRFEYKKATLIKIHDAIERGEEHKKEKPIRNPEDSDYIKVVLPKKIAHACRHLAAQIKQEDIGFRVHHQVRRLVMAVAARDRRKVATEKDFRVIAAYADFLAADGEVMSL